MTAITIRSFGQIQPKKSPEVLPDDGAQRAININVESGRLTSKKDSLLMAARETATQGDMAVSTKKTMGRVDVSTDMFHRVENVSPDTPVDYVNEYTFRVNPGFTSVIDLSAQTLPIDLSTYDRVLVRGYFTQENVTYGSIDDYQNDNLIQDICIADIEDSAITFLVVTTANMTGAADTFIDNIVIDGFVIDFDDITFASSGSNTDLYLSVSDTNWSPIAFSAGPDKQEWLIMLQRGDTEKLFKGPTTVKVVYKAVIPAAHLPHGQVLIADNDYPTKILRPWTASPTVVPPELQIDEGVYYRTEILRLPGDLRDNVAVGDLLKSETGTGESAPNNIRRGEVLHVEFRPSDTGDVSGDPTSRFSTGATWIWFKRGETMYTHSTGNPTPPDVSLATYPYDQTVMGDLYAEPDGGSSFESFFDFSGTGSDITVDRRYKVQERVFIHPGSGTSSKHGGFLESPIQQDKHDRVYWVDDQYPKVGTKNKKPVQNRPSPIQNYISIVPYRLGIPAPRAAPEILSVTGTGIGYKFLTSYVYTYVSAYGEEGPPSLISEAQEFYEGEVINLQLIIDDYIRDNTEFNFSENTLVRLYRTVVGSTVTNFQFVSEHIMGSSKTLAVSDDTAVTTDAALGEVLPSKNWVKPPDDDLTLNPNGPLKGIELMPGANFFVGFVGHTLCFSESFLPHAWPVEYRQVLDDEIVGIAPLTTGMAVMTKTSPHILAGATPDVVSAIKTDFSYGCVSQESIVDMGGVVVYASQMGLVLIAGNQISLLTEDILTLSIWQREFIPRKIKAYRHRNKYVAVLTREITNYTPDGTEEQRYFSGFEYDFETRTFNTIYSSDDTSETGLSLFRWSPSIQSVTTGHFDAEDNLLYLVGSPSRYATNTDEYYFAYEQATHKKLQTIWRSKKFVTQKPLAMSVLQVRTQDRTALAKTSKGAGANYYCFKARVYASGNLVSEMLFYDKPYSGDEARSQVSYDDGVTLVDIRDDAARFPATRSDTWEIEIEMPSGVDNTFIYNANDFAIETIILAETIEEIRQQ